jgi:crotonobetainyl-CoA:carnitine CoA-transferase CaiB-like acyl-CoA transferase
VVVDLSIVLAGPTCGRVLSDLGADVLKVDDPQRPISPYGWLEVNRGKRSMLLDLRHDDAREILWRLVAGADVLVENYRHGKLAQLGFDLPTVAAARPGIVYASLNAFDVGGSWDQRAGWEHNAQAATGMQLALPGWGPGRPPDQVTFPLNDFGTGVLGAYGIMLALRQRDATGRAQFVGGSLARTATFIQSPLFEDPEQPAAALRWLRCRDGYVGVLHSDADHLAESSALAELTREDAVAALRALGREAVVVRSSAELAGQPWVRDAELMVDWTHPRWGPLHQSRPHGSSSTFSPDPSSPAADPGADTAALLAEHGYDEPEIEKLFAAGTVASVPLFEMWSLA